MPVIARQIKNKAIVNEDENAKIIRNLKEGKRDLAWRQTDLCDLDLAPQRFKSCATWLANQAEILTRPWELAAAMEVGCHFVNIRANSVSCTARFFKSIAEDLLLPFL